MPYLNNDEEKYMEQKRMLAKILGRYHVGHDNAITAKELADIIGRQDDAESCGNTRHMITKIVGEDLLPVGATKYGFFVIRDNAELEQYVHTLQARIDSIADRIRAVQKAYKARGGAGTHPNARHSAEAASCAAQAGLEGDEDDAET